MHLYRVPDTFCKVSRSLVPTLAAQVCIDGSIKDHEDLHGELCLSVNERKYATVHICNCVPSFRAWQSEEVQASTMTSELDDILITFHKYTESQTKQAVRLAMNDWALPLQKLCDRLSLMKAWRVSHPSWMHLSPVSVYWDSVSKASW